VLLAPLPNAVKKDLERAKSRDLKRDPKRDHERAKSEDLKRDPKRDPGKLPSEYVAKSSQQEYVVCLNFKGFRLI
jgi:hypothetical protein